MIAPRPFVIKAIQEKRIVRIVFDREEVYIEPHKYGSTSQQDELIYGFVVRPTSFRFSTQRINDARIVEATGESFEGPRDGYQANSVSLDVVFAEI